VLGALGLMASGTKITIGEHAVVAHPGGLTINMDIVWSTLIAAAFVLTLGGLMARKATAGVPGRLQLAWEVIVEQIQELTDSTIGPEGRQFVPLAVVLFVLILTCNWIEVIPSGHNPEWLPAPTGDVNLPLAMALTVFVLIHYNSIKARGFKGYCKHYATPFVAFVPINIIEELTKPITLTLRLFGNIFAGGLMVVVIASLFPIYIAWVGELIWKPFDMFIGLIQAFIFALLTIVYLGMAMTKDPAH
jgi:F-type H+-transporting ATPase subunit a